jgi:hypothetical protein
MAGRKGMRGVGLGGRRAGAGRKPGAKNKRTRETVERVAVAAARDQLEDVVVLLTRWANDATKDDHFRAACAGKAAEFTHSKPSRLPERLPLPHEIPKWMLEDYKQRLEQDQREYPDRYGRTRPKPRLVTS